jgi:uncharacterized protein YukE
MNAPTNLRIGRIQSNTTRTPEERAERFNQAMSNFVQAMDRASNGIKDMGSAWENARVIVAPAAR